MSERGPFATDRGGRRIGALTDPLPKKKGSPSREGEGCLLVLESRRRKQTSLRRTTKELWKPGPTYAMGEEKEATTAREGEKR